MGRRGPTPETVETLRIRGSKEAYDRKGEVPIIHGEMGEPAELDGEALAEWRRMVQYLSAVHVESPSWRSALIQYCRAWAEYRRLDDMCQSLEVPWVVSDKGNLSRHPAFAQRDATFDRVLKMGREFGYTPASKTMVRSSGGSDRKSPKNRFMKGTG